MPPQNPSQLEITPYTSTVPLVQIPPAQIEADTRPAQPLQGQFGRKGTGALAIGDALLKGFMEGHQQKELRKNAQAQASISAADAATQAAFAKYQDALTQAGGKVDDPGAKAAYDAYLGVFNQAKATKSQFAMPEEKKKGEKGKGEKGKDGKGKGFGGIKEFLEANPHIVPQIALMTMQPQQPGLSPENKARMLDMQAAEQNQQEGELKLRTERRKEADINMVSAYGKLSPEEIAKLPADVQKQINDPQNGLKAAQYRIALEQPAKAKYDWFVDENGQQHSLPEGTLDVPPGWKLIAKPTAGSIPKLGTVGDFLETVAGDNKTDAAKLNASQKGYLEQLWHFYQTNPTASTSVSWYVDDKGDWQPRTAPGYRGQVPPKPPAGVFPSNFVLPGAPPPQGGQTPPAAKTGTGGITKPPSKTAAAKTGGMPATPQRAGEKPPMRSWQASQNTEKVATEQHDRYQKSQATYDSKAKEARAALEKGNIDQTGYQRMLNQAALDRADSNRETWKWYIQQVHSVGGKMPWEQQGAPVLHKDQKGNIYGFDGKNWVNIENGEQYQEQ